MRRAVSRILPTRNKSADSGISFSSSPSQLTHGQGTSHVEHFPAHSSTLSSTLSSLSSFKIDFTSVEEFYISVDEPHKLWLPGEEVSGQIILISKKNLANIAITLSLVGTVKINASSHSKLRPVKHTLFNHTIKIYGGDELMAPTMTDQTPQQASKLSNGLYKGEHRFPFIVKLPNKRIYTSIDFGKGAIIYLLKACIGNVQTGSSFSANANESNTGAAANTAGSNTGSNVSSPGTDFFPKDTTSKLINKAKQIKMLNNSAFTSEKLINLINPIDVAKLPPAKPKRMVLKDPRNNKKLSRTYSSTSTVNTFATISSNNSDFIENESNSTPTNIVQLTTGGTLASASTHSAVGTSLAVPPVTPLTDSGSVVGLISQKRPDTIKVSLEIPHRGYLRGELIPIKLEIQHLKKIQDLSGIIITFVRVCRIDNGSEMIFDSFRKDLQQLVIPLFVDPNTFQSEISTSVRVPVDSFPTITGCPLVSFQYFIEVLINLSGKSLVVEANDSNIPGASGNELILGAASSSPFNFNYQPHGTFDSKERSTYINTDKYKRMKKFLQLTTEVIIGTHRLKSNPNRTASYSTAAHNELPPPIMNEGSIQSLSPISRRSSLVSGSNIPTLQDNHISQNELNDDIVPPRISSRDLTPPYFENDHVQPPAPLTTQAVPEYDDQGLIPLPEQSNLSEKNQMRIREFSLLPSAPPLDNIEEDYDGVSPINGNEDILQTFTEPPRAEYDPLYENNQALYHRNDVNTNENNFDYENQNRNEQGHQHHHEQGNDQYSVIDFVPNYESVNYDTLVTFDRDNENGSSSDPRLTTTANEASVSFTSASLNEQI